MANALLVAGAAAAIGYYGFIKPRQEKKKKAAAASQAPPPPVAQPRIQFSELCHWQIPDAWWTDVGAPKFTAILERELAGLPTWEAKLTKFQSPTLNSQVVAHEILEGQGTDACPFPPANADVFNPPPTLTEQQRVMNNLFAHMINHVDASFGLFIQSQGTRIQFPVILAVPEEG